MRDALSQSLLAVMPGAGAGPENVIGACGRTMPNSPVMKVADLMSREVEYISLDATIVEAAELMGELDVGALPAGSSDGIEGVLTDRDILYRVVARGRDPTDVIVREVLSRPVVACQEDDSLKTAMDVMAAHHVRRLPVQNPSGAIAGWITLSDIARALLVGSTAMQEGLREVSETETEP